MSKTLTVLEEIPQEDYSSKELLVVYVILCFCSGFLHTIPFASYSIVHIELYVNLKTNFARGLDKYT